MSGFISCITKLAAYLSLSALWVGSVSAASINVLDEHNVQVVGSANRVEKCSIRLANDYIWMRVFPGEAKGPFRFRPGYHYSQVSLRCRGWQESDGDPAKHSLWVQVRKQGQTTGQAAIYYAGLSRLN